MSKETYSAVLKEHWEKVALGASALLLVTFFAYGLLFASPDAELRELEEQSRTIGEALKKNPFDVGAKPDYRREFNAPWQTPVGAREVNAPLALDWLPFAVGSRVITYKKPAADVGVPVDNKFKVKILPTPVIEALTAATESGVTVQWKINDKLPPSKPDEEEWATPSHYVVDRRAKGKGDFVTVAKEVKDLKFVDKEVEAMTEYEYRVTAVSLDPTIKKAMGAPGEAKAVKTASNIKISFGGSPPEGRLAIMVTVSVFKDDVWHAGTITATGADEVKDQMISEGEVLNGAIRCAEKHVGDQKCNKSFEVKSNIKIQKIERVEGLTMIKYCSQCKKEIFRLTSQTEWKVSYLDEEGVVREMWRGDKGPVQFDICPDCRKKAKPASPAPPKTPKTNDQPPKVEDKPPKPDGGKKGEIEKKPIR